MARARVEQHPGTTGNALLVAVSLGIVFLLFLAFLGVVKQGNLFTEANLLYVALIFYAGASALYIGFGVTGVERYVRFASLATLIGFLANTLAAGHRWYIAGHPPFASIYEMLLSFVWTVAGLTMLAERRYGVKVIGTVTMPLAVVGVVLMQLLPSSVRPLVPARSASTPGRTPSGPGNCSTAICGRRSSWNPAALSPLIRRRWMAWAGTRNNAPMSMSEVLTFEFDIFFLTSLVNSIYIIQQ